MANTTSDWSSTIILPKTVFEMRANLILKEPKILGFWSEKDIYKRVLAQRKQDKASTFILHDGPPYANGHFHVGHALNKILKDFIIKDQLLQGKYVPYVPGWDCHGLPIEHAVVKKLSNKKSPDARDPIKVRQACRKYAEEYVRIQAAEQTRFGVFWDSKSLDKKELENNDSLYITMSPSYEAATLEAFKDLFKKDLIYKDKKPVYWCPTLGTAHAEAEIEYQEHESPSIYVAFPVKKDKNVFVVIWTTTPWTLPANKAVCFHSSFSYTKYFVGDRQFILAEGLEKSFFADIEATYISKEPISQEEIKHLIVEHPFMEQESKVVFGNHVTLDAGTGIVHTAPGHGQDDYRVGLEHGLEIFSPVDDYGKYTSEFKDLEGTKVFVANDIIIEWLKERNLLLGLKRIRHSYPYSWRSKKPLIIRATPQWFLHVEKLKTDVKKACSSVNWVPDYGEKRFLSMIEKRPDWCLSRQRFWGVPIPELLCNKCGDSYITTDFLEKIIKEVFAFGIEIWFEKELSDLLKGEIIECSSCGSHDFTKGNNILDVWFDSGVSWYTVLMKNPNLQFPADVYLEGSDQHRGWFQSSFWPSLALNQKPPFRSVITHGYVLDGQGKAMSKSVGNVISPIDDVINKYGADVLRLWVASEDFRTDNTINSDILKRVVDSYRKIRNTFRFLLGNLQDQEKISSKTPLKYTVLDKWILSSLKDLDQRVKGHYEKYEFFRVYHEILNFCIQKLSNEYFDIVRDSLYCDSSHKVNETNLINNPELISIFERRLSVQSVLSTVLEYLLFWLAPILSFTCEEIYQVLHTKKSIFEEVYPSNDKLDSFFSETQLMNKILDIKDKINLILEEARHTKKIIARANAVVMLPDSLKSDLLQCGITLNELSRYYLVASVKFYKGEVIKVESSDMHKCPRCWQYHSVHEEKLCERCDLIIHL